MEIDIKVDDPRFTDTVKISCRNEEKGFYTLTVQAMPIYFKDYEEVKLLVTPRTENPKIFLITEPQTGMKLTDGAPSVEEAINDEFFAAWRQTHTVKDLQRAIERGLNSVMAISFVST